MTRISHQEILQCKQARSEINPDQSLNSYLDKIVRNSSLNYLRDHGLIQNIVNMNSTKGNNVLIRNKSVMVVDTAVADSVEFTHKRELSGDEY